ncbi:MAG: ATP-binding protein [Pleomorphochaeta sp.]
MKKTIIIITLFLLINNCIFSDTQDIHKNDSTIKVACVKDSGYIKLQSDNKYVGFLANYLEEIGEFHNLHFEYIMAENNQQCLDFVEQGKADISCIQYKDEKLKEKFEFNDLPIDILNTNLYALEGNNNYYYDDFENFNNMIVGIREDLSTIDSIIEYEKQHNIQLKIIKYDSEISLLNALNNKEIDSIITDYAKYSNTKLISISEISSSPVYIIAMKGDSITSVINESINLSTEKNRKTRPNFISNNNNNIYSINAFTKEETDFINEQEVITVGLLPDTYIQSRYNSKTKKYEGIIVDYMKEIEKNSNLKFEFILIPFGLTAPEAIAQGLCDISPYLNRNYSTIHNSNIDLTINYINMKQLITFNKNNPKNLEDIKTVSCPSNYQGLLNFIHNNYPQWEVYKTNANNILDPLVKGKVDVTIGNEYEIKYLMKNPKYSDIFATENYLTNVFLSIGIKKNNPILLSILNKSISNIDNSTLEYIILKGAITNYQYSFYDSYYANRDFFNLIIFLAFTIITCMYLFTRYQKNINTKIKKNEQELNLSNQKYEKANKAKSEFLASMSHDLRTPMNAIIGLTELSKNNITNTDQVEEYINKIDISSKYLLGLINDILDISAIEDGKLSILNAPLNLKNLVQEITTMYNVNSQQKNIYFHVNLNRIYHENLKGDYFRIKQIITNLLSNAFKFTPKEGTVYLTVSEISSGENMILLNIVVKDTGIGISKELQNKIFLKFVQADSDTFNKYGGSGLGLSIVSNLVSLMNGTITLKSKKNEGSIFSINIPLEIDNSINHKILKKDSTKNNKILIVDTEIESTISFHKQLKTINIENDYCINLSEALIKTQKADKSNSPYNIIIIDNNFITTTPNFFESDLCKYYIQENKYLIISGYDITYLKKALSNKEIKHYLRKPMFLSSIEYIIENLDHLHSTNISDYSYLNQKLSGLKVLLCEDNDINQLVGKHLIETFGCEVSIAENGLIGLNKFINNHGSDYDLILMDIRMPIMNGLEATQKIRKSNIKNSKNIPIYALTANVTKSDIEESTNFGMNGHISKPINSNKLYNILKEIWLTKNIEINN